MQGVLHAGTRFARHAFMQQSNTAQGKSRAIIRVEDQKRIGFGNGFRVVPGSDRRGNASRVNIAGLRAQGACDHHRGDGCGERQSGRRVGHVVGRLVNRHCKKNFEWIACADGSVDEKADVEWSLRQLRRVQF